jgi:hypothetical protein
MNIFLCPASLDLDDLRAIAVDRFGDKQYRRPILLDT